MDEVSNRTFVMRIGLHLLYCRVIDISYMKSYRVYSLHNTHTGQHLLRWTQNFFQNCFINFNSKVFLIKTSYQKFKGTFTGVVRKNFSVFLSGLFVHLAELWLSKIALRQGSLSIVFQVGMLLPVGHQHVQKNDLLVKLISVASLMRQTSTERQIVERKNAVIIAQLVHHWTHGIKLRVDSTELFVLCTNTLALHNARPFASACDRSFPGSLRLISN